MKTMRRLADKVLVIFPFEEPIYRDAGVSVEWVGHPLFDVQPAREPRDAFLARHGLDPARPILALLPGSRANELREILPTVTAAAALVRQRVPGVQLVVARAPHLRDELLRPIEALPDVVAVEGHTDDVLAVADAAIVASGTVTVQAALHDCPMVVVYRLSSLTYKVGKPFVHVDTYAMVNLIAGRRIVQELIQDDFTAEAVAAEATRLLTDRAHASRMKADLREVREKLGGPGASRRAADAVLAIAASRYTV
jgi:lipid-A-disaccharide synthase